MDLFKPLVGPCLLASAAEDRSIVVWSSQIDEFCTRPHSRFTDWFILYRLDPHVPDLNSIIFESRIWCVQMNAWGIVAAGEVRVEFS